MNHTLTTHTKDDIIRAYRVLCQRNPDGKQIKVLHDDVSNVHHVVSGNTIIYTLEPVDRELYFNYRLPELQQKTHFTVDTFASQLLGTVDILNARRCASDDNYSLIPAFIEHCFDLFAVIDSAKLSEQVAALTVKHFNMCHHLSSYNINFKLSHLAARLPVEDMKAHTPNVEEFAAQLKTSGDAGNFDTTLTPTAALFNNMRGFSDLPTLEEFKDILVRTQSDLSQAVGVDDAIQRPSTDDLPDDTEYENISNDRIEKGSGWDHEFNIPTSLPDIVKDHRHIHGEVVSGNVETTAAPDEPSESDFDWLEEKPAVAEPAPRVGFTPEVIVPKVVANLLEHPLIKVLIRIDNQDGVDWGNLETLNLKLIEPSSSDIEETFNPSSAVNPSCFAELIGYEFINTNPHSSDDVLLKAFTFSKVLEYLPVMYNPELLNVKDDDYHSVHYLTDPAKWVASSRLHHVVFALFVNALKRGSTFLQSTDDELLAIDEITLTKKPKLRSVINSNLSKGYLVPAKYAEYEEAIQLNNDSSYYCHTVLRQEGEMVRATLLDMSDTAINLVVAGFTKDKESGDWVLGTVAKREFTRVKDVSDVILIIANILGFDIAPDELPDTNVE